MAYVNLCAKTFTTEVKLTDLRFFSSSIDQSQFFRRISQYLKKKSEMD